VLGGDTRLSGFSGNTSPLVDVPMPGDFATPDFAADLTAASSAAAVLRPTTPVAGERWWASWNCLTADAVSGPKSPSIETG
jgi:hypothetical protein